MFLLFCCSFDSDFAPLWSSVGVFQATERMEYLDGLINNTQAMEQQMMDLSQWIVDVDDLLRSRRDADVVAADLPEEFEVRDDVIFTDSGRFHVILADWRHFHR